MWWSLHKNPRSTGFGEIFWVDNHTQITGGWQTLQLHGNRSSCAWDPPRSHTMYFIWVLICTLYYIITGPGMLQFMGSQRVGYDWEIELKWTEIGKCKSVFPWVLWATLENDQTQRGGHENPDLQLADQKYRWQPGTNDWHLIWGGNLVGLNP